MTTVTYNCLVAFSFRCCQISFARSVSPQYPNNKAICTGTTTTSRGSAISNAQYLKHNHFPADRQLMEIPKNTKIPSRDLLPCPVSTLPRSQTPASSTMPRNHRGVN
ncbi:hypothetical protein DPMN_002817 [Dreissena polymorpha]|uniref:Uncharacterized protein n=1 Tax=Dreissena polymorpha TaxID=45954 RepID=A0A9D4MMB9_DREPO|nr:hypothetical protein DPMN_002817 [Dreissena polymorpha]